MRNRFLAGVALADTLNSSFTSPHTIGDIDLGSASDCASQFPDLAEAAGSDRVRFTPYQKLVILDVPDDKLESPEYASEWQTRYCIDAMLEHAVMHPIRHRFQLDELLGDL